MKQRFQMLNDPRFHLVYGKHQGILRGPAPSKVRLNREGFTLVNGIKKKSAVYPGMLLAEHPSLDKGDLFAPIVGEVTEITERSIFIKAAENQENAEASPTIEPASLLNGDLRGEDLVLAVKKLGVNTKSLGQECDTLIINGLNPEPGITWAESVLTSQVSTWQAGVTLLRRFGRAKKIILAIPKGMQLAYEGIEVAHVSPEYPESVNELVIRNVTGKEKPEGVACVSLHNVWSLGCVARTGLPLTETILTVDSYGHWENYIVKDGAFIGEILTCAGTNPVEGDTVLRGGPLRGESIDRLDRSITKGTAGIFVVEQGAVPPMQGHSPCVNCGACVLVCPARLAPSALSNYAEFALHDRCRKEHIFSCLDCGLCGYVCIARRPVLQYIRLAKHKLMEEDRLKELEHLDASTPAEGEQ